MPKPSRPRIAFASHELWPYVQGGGIARSVWAAATLLREHADVTVLTASTWENAYRQFAADDPRALPGVRVLFAHVPEGGVAPLRSWQHAWSMALLEALRAAYPDGGPDLLEFNDYWGEGAMTVEARRSGERFLGDTTIAVRTRTTHEITAALNGEALGALERTLHGLERIALRGADVILYPGGDVAGTYERFYGSAALAPLQRLPETFIPVAAAPADCEPPAGERLRLLYLGRLERRKGVEDLVDAMLGLDAEDVCLTLVGGDTDTAPGGGSMRSWLEQRSADDDRIAFRDRVAHEELGAVFREHHAVVSASRWESWSNVVRESLAANRPVLATPVGGVIDAIRPDRTGWLVEGTSAEDLRSGIETLRDRRADVERLIAEATPRACLEAMLGHDEIVAAVLDLARAKVEPRAAAPVRRPLTALMHWSGDSAAFTRAIEALDATETPVRVTLLTPDGLPPARLAWGLFDVIRDEPGKEADMLRAALDRADGDAVLLLDARDVLDRDFLPRALAALGSDREIAYVGALTKDDRPPAPLSNAAAPALGADILSGPIVVRAADLAGLTLPDRQGRDMPTAVALLLAGRERWGVVIPDPLVRRASPRAPLSLDVPVSPRSVPATVWLAPEAARPRAER